MRLELRLPELLPLIGALVMSLVTPVTVLITLREAEHAAGETREYAALLFSSSRLMSALLDAETGQRGYLVTGRQEFLDPYNTAKSGLPSLLHNLKDAGKSVPEAGRELESLERLASEKIRLVDEVLRLYEQGGLAASAPLLPKGKAIMDEIRDNVRQNQEAWLRQISADSDRLKSVSRVSWWVALLGCGITAALLIGGAWRLNHSMGTTRNSLARVREAEGRYAQLTARLQQVREDESGQLARRVHDDLGQSLTAIRFDLSSMLRRLEGRDPALQEQVRKTISLSDEVIKTVRNIAVELRPGVLDQLGLVAALEWLGAEFQKRYSVKVTLKADTEVLNISRDTQLALFRISQEALTNVARHSQAKNVSISLRTPPGEVLLDIGDDGVGIPPEKLDRPRTVGLFSMEERARLAGAELRILSRPGTGTTIRVILPVREGSRNIADAQTSTGSR
jgi:signal transduction histidine kinase